MTFLYEQAGKMILLEIEYGSRLHSSTYIAEIAHKSISLCDFIFNVFLVKALEPRDYK